MWNNREEKLNYFKNRYSVWRDSIIEYLGGQCVVCGLDSGLVFDHIDPSTKSYDIAYVVGARLEDIIEELEKCQLLCTVCNKDKTSLDLRNMRLKQELSKYPDGINHGSTHAWEKKKCTCGVCLKAKLEYREINNARKRKPGGRGPYKLRSGLYG